MPNVTDVDQLIEDTATNEGQYLLILVDEKSNTSAYCLFMPGEFTTTMPDGVHQLFDESMRILAHPSTIYFSSQELPILTQIGPWAVTVVERSKEDGITIRDGRGEPAESHMGVGG